MTHRVSETCETTCKSRAPPFPVYVYHGSTVYICENSKLLAHVVCSTWLIGRLDQRGCKEVVRYEYFVAMIPVFSTFSHFFKKNYKSHFM